METVPQASEQIGIGRRFGQSGARSVEMRNEDAPMSDDDLRARLSTARQAHGDLDAAVDALARRDVPDQLQLARLKRQKLRLRDEVIWLEQQLIPDIIA